MESCKIWPNDDGKNLFIIWTFSFMENMFHMCWVDIQGGKSKSIVVFLLVISIYSFIFIIL